VDWFGQYLNVGVFLKVQRGSWSTLCLLLGFGCRMSFHSESESDTLDVDGKTRQNCVWKTVHVKVHCPSRGFNQLVTIIDPVSKWIFAESVPADECNAGPCMYLTIPQRELTSTKATAIPPQ